VYQESLLTRSAKVSKQLKVSPCQVQSHRVTGKNLEEWQIWLHSPSVQRVCLTTAPMVHLWADGETNNNRGTTETVEVPRTTYSFTRTVTEMRIHSKTHGSSNQFFRGNHFTAKIDFLRHMFTRTDATTRRCCLCPTEFASKEALLKHLNTHATDAGSKRQMARAKPKPLLKLFQCKICTYMTRKLANMRRHLQSHSGERPFGCPQCSARLKQHLKVHIRSHTGERPFACRHCPKSFAQNDDLVRHTRIHTGERPFKCPECPRTFTQSTGLKSHVKTHCREAVHKCDRCSLGFRTKNGLGRHRAMHDQ
ncbi:hypothetical protein HPB47_003917, partial [Ixodes persulcatus]